MKYPLATATLLSLLVGIAAPANANNSSVELALESYGGSLSVFHQALVNTGVASELKENVEYTVFVPTNAAFSEIRPNVYPCFYSVQCKAQVAAVLRNHIVPRQLSLKDLSVWGGPVSTIGARGIRVQEAYKNEYTAEGNRVLNRGEGDRVDLYIIDGVIMDNRERTLFRAQPVAESPDAVSEKTVTVRRTTIMTPISPNGYLVPGGYSAAPESRTNFEEHLMSPDEMPDNTTETTTTITRTRKTQ